MMSIQEYTLQELIGSQQGQRICRPEVCFTILRPASWCTCIKQCVHVIGTECTAGVCVYAGVQMQTAIQSTLQRLDAAVKPPLVTSLHNLSSS